MQQNYPGRRRRDDAKFYTRATDLEAGLGLFLITESYAMNQKDNARARVSHHGRPSNTQAAFSIFLYL